MKSQSLVKGKKIELEANSYYSNESGVFVTHYYYPEEFIKITNRNGEMKVYFPETKEVSLQQNYFFSSENELLHFFVNNLTEDLGLRNAGFTLMDSRYDGPYLVTSWAAPPEIPGILIIDIVYEDMRPIYSEYLNKDGKTIKKIYYSDYYYGSSFVLPRNITEIDFPSKNDSIVKRILYSNILLNKEVSSEYLNFTIPADAKIID